MDLSELDISIIDGIGDRNNHEQEVSEPEMFEIFSVEEKEKIDQ